MWEEELKTMEKPWGPKTVSLMAADGKLIILENDGTLHIAEVTPASYQEISSCDVLDGEHKYRQFWTPPVLCNGKIYCRNYAGDLLCIDVSK
jgi:outer membrane protein assembly factor BamB